MCVTISAPRGVRAPPKIFVSLSLNESGCPRKTEAQSISFVQGASTDVDVDLLAMRRTDVFRKPTMPELVSYLSKVPLVGRVVLEAAKRSSQRHKCSACGVVGEVNVGDIISNPLKVLTTDGRRGLEAAEGTDSAPPPVSVDDAKGGETDDATIGDGGDAEAITKQVSDILLAVEAVPEPSPTGAVLSTDDSARTETEGFRCNACGGRLGVHTFPGDATNGVKEVLMERLFALFDAIPEVIALSVPPHRIRAISKCDVFWVD